jgi:hypothetical protein
MSAPALSPLNVRVTVLEPNWGHALRVRWSWQWRVLVFMLLMGLFIRLCLSYLMAGLGMTASWFEVFGSVLGFVLSGLVSLYIFKDLLDSDFSNFRLCIIAKDLPPQ